MISKGPFQPKLFYDSMYMCSSMVFVLEAKVGCVHESDWQVNLYLLHVSSRGIFPAVY